MKPDVNAAREELANDPDNLSLQLALARKLILLSWYDSKHWSENYAEATSIYKNILKSDPDNGIALVNLGVTFSDRGDSHNAMKYYRKAESLGWVDGNLTYNIGVALINMSQQAKGIQTIKTSNNMKKHPETLDAYFDPHAL